MKSSLSRLSLLMLLLAGTAGAEGADPMSQISAWGKAPSTCRRDQLITYLRSEDVRVRSAALDLLEDITGRDFGLDPWLAPSEVPEQVRRELDAWVAAEQMLGERAEEPSEQQLQDTLALLRRADADTLRRVCRRYERYRTLFVAAVQRELEAQPAMQERERDNLRMAQYRVYLEPILTTDTELVVSKLVSHVRSDVLEGLEALRAAGKSTLPIVACYVASDDALLRETAVDIALQQGLSHGFVYLMPRLMREPERNILQIAARRAPDSRPLGCIIRFLNKCAMSSDEDVAVAALEALKEMKLSGVGPTAHRETAGQAYRLADTSDVMPLEDFRQLVASPHWRVRAAALGTLRSLARYVPDVNSPDIKPFVFAALQDEDETVRQTALEVIFMRQLLKRDTQDALLSYALKNPDHAPLVVFLFVTREDDNETVPVQLVELVEHFSPDQVDQMSRMDEEFGALFSQDVPMESVATLRAALMRNASPQVRERLFAWCGPVIAQHSEQMGELVMDWLENPATLAEDRLRFLRATATSGQKGGDEKGVGAAWSHRFLEWLHRCALQQEDALLAQEAYQALIRCDAALAAEVFRERVRGMDAEMVQQVISVWPDQLQALRPEDQLWLLEHSGGDGSGRMIEVLTQSQSGERMLSENDLPQEAWYKGVVARLHNSPMGDVPAWSEVVLRRALSAESPERRQVEAAMLVFSRAQETPLRADALRVIEQVSPEKRAFLLSLSGSPTRPEEVEPWAMQHAESPYASVRAAVASCLLPVRGWCFLLPPEQDGEWSMRVCGALAGNESLRKISCPRALIEKVKSMQYDEDPRVSLLACASMLYRMGTCDVEVLTKRLNALLRLPAEDSERLAMAQVLDVVWRRWAYYRQGLEEPFKLKGSPQRVDPTLAQSLLLLREVAGESWGVNEAIVALIGRAQMPAQRKLQMEKTEFSFIPEKEEAPDASAVPSETDAGHRAEEVAPDDASDGEGVAPLAWDRSQPVRVEFFHKAGCGNCELVERYLTLLRVEYPALEVVDYGVETPKGYERNDVLCSRFGVPGRQWHKAPALFAEGGYLMGEDITEAALRELLDASLASQSKHLLQQNDVAVSSSPTDHQAAVAPHHGESRLDATATHEAAAAQRARAMESFKSYAVLSLGAVVLLAVLLLLLLRSRKSGKGE